MAGKINNELVFEVTAEAEGGYAAGCLTESIVAEGDTWEELRASVKDAGCFFDRPKPQAIRPRLVRNEVLLMQ